MFCCKYQNGLQDRAPHLLLIGICALNRIRKSVWYITSFCFKHMWCKCTFYFQEYLRAQVQVRTCLYWKKKTQTNPLSVITTAAIKEQKQPSLPSFPFQHKRIKYASLPPHKYLQCREWRARRGKWGIRRQQEAGGSDFVMWVWVLAPHGSKCCGGSTHPSRERLLFQLEFQTGEEWGVSWDCLDSVVMREAWCGMPWEEVSEENRNNKQKVCQYLYFPWHWYFAVLYYQIEWSQSQQPLPLTTGWGAFLA